MFVELYRKTRALADGERRAADTRSSSATRAQEALNRSNQELERRVQERTAALTIARNRASSENEERLRMAMDGGADRGLGMAPGRRDDDLVNRP